MGAAEYNNYEDSVLNCEVSGLRTSTLYSTETNIGRE